VRILGEVKKEYADILRLADDIFMQELRASGWYDKTAQAFAVFQPVKSVGVVGDGRHPFPGPGLGVRILGEVKKEYADILRLADDIFMQELRASGWYDKTAQAFAVFQPVKSVGVVGDGRRYAWVIALRAVETVDFMTARFAHLPYELVDKISTRIMNEIKDVSRVVYDVSSKPPATIEWE